MGHGRAESFINLLPMFQNLQQTCITCWASPKMYFSTSLCSISFFCRWTWASSSSSLFIFHSTSSEEEDSRAMGGTSATESRWPGHCQHRSYISQATAAQIRRFILILSTSMTPREDKKKKVRYWLLNVKYLKIFTSRRALVDCLFIYKRCQ